jgi:hypothetical protein
LNLEFVVAFPVRLINACQARLINACEVRLINACQMRLINACQVRQGSGWPAKCLAADTRDLEESRTDRSESSVRVLNASRDNAA